jgi:hypothetical protein
MIAPLRKVGGAGRDSDRLKIRFPKFAVENSDLKFAFKMQIPAGECRQGSAEKMTDGGW